MTASSPPPPSDAAGLGEGTDISAADLDVEGEGEHVATTDPDSFDDDPTLGGNGGADRTGGGAG